MSKKRTLILLSMVLPILAAAALLGAFTALAAPNATITVTNTNDSGGGSLRQAIADAISGDTINFAAGLNGKTITLVSELSIDKSLTISGSAPITVNGNNVTRVFNVTAGNVTFDSLTIANGNVRTFDCWPFHSKCGGGIMIQNSSVAVTVTNSTLISNTAHSRGGGIYNNHGTLTVNNSTLSGNSADFIGGGICNIGTLTVNSSALSGNSALYGGGIDNSRTLTVNNSTLSGNSASAGGGIDNSGTLTVNNSTLSDNTANFSGGGISNLHTLTVNNSTLSGNSASDGGGIDNSGEFHLRNTILANTPSGNDCASGDGLDTGINNLIEVNDGCGTPISSADPLLGPLQDNGGPTWTHALLLGSPAIDAGDNPTCLATDQRGITRPQNTSCDIGAFETRGFELTVSRAGTGSGSVSSTPAGIDCGGDCSETYSEGTVVTLTADADTGSTFTGWSGDCSGTAACVVIMYAAKSVTATFMVTYDVFLPVIMK